MALALGKVAILVGAGLVGSVLAREGRLPTVSDFFSGAYKVVLKQIRHDETKPSSSKPRNDSLMAQVNSLRQELQLLASNRPITIVTSTGSGSSKVGIVVIVVVLGYGYVWWKGWKLPDWMFIATKRSLSDACNTIAKKLENVHSSMVKTKRELSSRMDRVDSNIDECADITIATREEVSELRGETKGIGGNVHSVRDVVRTLETKISRIEGKQDFTNEGVFRLVHYARNLENLKTAERIQESPSSSRPALEIPLGTPSRTASLLPIPSPEPQSPSTSDGSGKRPLQNAASASGLKELHGILRSYAEQSSMPAVSNAVHITEETNNGFPGSGVFGRRFLGITPSFLTRTRSNVQSFK